MINHLLWKCVPLADYVDCTAKERKAYSDESFEPYHIIKNCIFSDIEKSKRPVSPRALKHLNDLMMLSNEEQDLMCYAIQRGFSSFQPSVIDEAYRNMFYKAQEAGVENIQFVE